MDIFSIFATPLGGVMSLIYRWLNSYFLTILLFTLLIRLLMFPLSLKSQKSQAERARLAPRLERLQKKYTKDPKKLQEKQMALYEKEGVKMTAGCLPSIIQMLVLFSVIAVIYKPLTYLQHLPSEAISASVTAVTEITDENGEAVVNARQLSGYYQELGLLRHAADYPDEIKMQMAQAGVADADAVYDQMIKVKEEFSLFGISLLEQPWDGITHINWLWLVAVLSGLSALATSLVSMHYTRATMAPQQPGQGCSTNMMMIAMPLMSLIISFTVPAGVGVYWIFSNILAMIQTVVLNQIYNPAKIRAAAQQEYEERRRRKQEDKQRLKEARLREQAAWQKAEKEAADRKKNPVKPTAADKKAPAAQPETEQEKTASPSTDEDGKDREIWQKK